MSKQKKNRFFLKHSKSSAMVVSVAIHAILVVVALTFVAVRVIIKEEQTFEAMEVQRPSMKLRQLQVPVKDQKKSQAPKLRKTIVSKPKTPTVDIKMPEITGVKGGTGYDRGGGLGGLGFGFDLDLFGGSKGGAGGVGNEFVGTFYDLKQYQDGTPSQIGELFAKKDGNTENISVDFIYGFISSGWNERRFERYFKAPKLKYSTVFMMPNMAANEAPKAFGVEDQVNPSYWLCHYKGQIAAPEMGRYRFYGLGDDVLTVRVAKKIVLDACWHNKEGRLSKWTSKDKNNRKYPLERDTQDPKQYLDFNSTLVVGDWFDLRQGQRVDMEVLIGELPGSAFSCRLLIEQEGKEYKMVPYSGGTRPVLPVFKTAEIDEKLASQMKINPNVATLDGPVFSVLINASKP